MENCFFFITNFVGGAFNMNDCMININKFVITFQTRNQELAANLDEHVQSNKELQLHIQELVSPVLSLSTLLHVWSSESSLTKHPSCFVFHSNPCDQTRAGRKIDWSLFID